MKRVSVYVLLALAVGALLSVNCKKVLPNQNPVISQLNAPSSINADGQTTVSCTASDPDGDELTYNWTCTQGTLSSSTGSSVTWYAPGASGTATVSVSVHDEHGAADSRSKSISIVPVTSTLVDWSGQVAHGEWTYWSFYIESGYTVSGDFWVDNYDITFLILSQSNYENWVNNNSYTYLVKVVQSAGTSFSATIPTDGTYYAVLDNTYSWLTDKFAHLQLRKTSP